MPRRFKWERKQDKENAEEREVRVYHVCQRRNADVRNRSGRINRMNFAILPQPGCCLHKTAPDSNKSWTAPWKPREEKTRMMRRGKRTKAITRGGERGERKTNGEMIKCSFFFNSTFFKESKRNQCRCLCCATHSVGQQGTETMAS